MKSHIHPLILLPLVLATLILPACGQQSTQEQQATGLEITGHFIPQSGMKLQNLADIPGVVWSFDTIRGVCAPDTMMLWMTYEDVDYLTNVTGTYGNFKMLEPSGEKKFKALDYGFTKLDFNPNAVLITNGLDITREEIRELQDTIFAVQSTILTNMIIDFFMSGGAIQYMAEPMASNWRLIQTQTERGELLPTNPLNGSPRAQFREGDVIVDIIDPAAGIAEVTAYCLDPYTLGHPGWAYWTVMTCKINGVYRIKETPIHHNRFVIG